MAGSHAPSNAQSKPAALIIRAPGTNCDVELARALELAGARAEVVHIDALVRDASPLERADLIGLPGGFSYGDDVASGRIFAARLKQHLYPQLRTAAARGCPMFAVCNGFQIIVQTGLLPGPTATSEAWPSEPAEQELSLAHNAGGRFIDAWVPVRAEAKSVCVWTKGLAEAFGDRPEAMMLPIAHGEGRVVAQHASTLDRLEAAGQIALRYGHVAQADMSKPHPENPNGSSRDIVGLCDVSGRIFGLMPHPERALDWNRYPFWTRMDAKMRAGDTPWRMMFRNAVEAARGVMV